MSTVSDREQAIITARLNSDAVIPRADLDALFAQLHAMTPKPNEPQMRLEGV